VGESGGKGGVRLGRGGGGGSLTAQITTLTPWQKVSTTHLAYCKLTLARKRELLERRED